jgi:acetolactate synthase-1/3 small subunit
MKHKNVMLSVLFNPKPGFVIRVALILERRSFEIKSLAITTEVKNGFSEMFIRIEGDRGRLDQVIRQLSKLIDVLYVEEVKDLENAASNENAGSKMYAGAYSL